MIKALFFTFLISLLLIFNSLASSQTKKMKEFKKKTKITDPFSLRDPFKAPAKFTKRGKRKKGQGIMKDGVFTNTPSLNPATQMEALKVVGIIVGKQRRAIVNVGGANIIVKEGMKIGPSKAELKAILPGGIVLVEKMINVYGQEEYLETVIPLSK